MPDLNEVIAHWGYLGIFTVVIIGNVGVPFPEETILILAGYLVWRGQLKLAYVLAVGIASAVAGDNIGYWIGRRYGRDAIERYGERVLLTRERIQATYWFVARYGPLGIFIARFIPGLRFMAGPVAGATGVQTIPFVVANLLGAAIYVPLAVGGGYAVGYGLGHQVEALRRLLGEIERLVLIAAGLGTVGLLARRAARARRARGARSPACRDAPRRSAP